MADTIKIGNLDINAFKVGSDDCKVYLGDTLLYPQTPPTPTFDGKWLATYSDSHTESADCEGSSSIEGGDIELTDLVSVEIGDCVTTIGADAFANCIGVTNVTIGSGVTSIGDRAFQYCSSLTSCTIGSGVTSIGNSVFNKCRSLTSIEIPNSVTSIDYMAFNECSGLTTCTIGSGVTSIDYMAFFGCTSLTSITVNATTPPTLGYDAFDITNNCPIYVPYESLNAYKTASVWSFYASRIQAIP